MQVKQSEGTDSLYDGCNLDKNRIIDFRPLQEMQSPMLANIWTTPQT